MVGKPMPGVRLIQEDWIHTKHKRFSEVRRQSDPVYKTGKTGVVFIVRHGTLVAGHPHVTPSYTRMYRLSTPGC